MMIDDSSTSLWPYLPTLQRLALALAIGLFVGIEREHRRKEAGLRTFGFVSVLGALGGLLGESYGLLALGLVGVLIVLLNVDTFRTGEGIELTTSAALLVTAFTGILAGQGHTVTPTALAVITAALLAWKKPLTGFSQALTDAEIRSAILLAILAFVVYPGLPSGPVDPWNLIALRAAWVTVILIAALGFVNYVLLKLYGDRGVAIMGFLGGLINSTVMITELVSRARRASGRLANATYRGVILSIAAMLVRNAIILGIFAPAALLAIPIPLILMGLSTVAIIVSSTRHSAAAHANSTEPENSSAVTRLSDVPALSSPFSITSTLKFGVLFLTLQVVGTLALRLLGQAGLYTVSLIGGIVSSSSAVASVAGLTAQGTVSPKVAGISAMLATLSSVFINFPIVARFTHDRALVRRIITSLGVICAAGVVGAVVQLLV